MDKDLGKAFEAMLEAETRLDQALRNGDIQSFLPCLGIRLTNGSGSGSNSNPILFLSDFKDAKKKYFFFLIVFSYIFRNEAGSGAQEWGHPVFFCRKVHC
jgi:hypothetical protein